MTTQQGSVGEMVAQSREIMGNPSIPMFERYEKRGSVSSAAIYVGIAALVAGVLGLVGSFFPGDPAPGIGGFLGGLIGALVQFFVFTGLVFYIGKSAFGGSGSWNEVAYSFALFSAPLIVIGALLGLIVSAFAWVPVLGGLVALLALLVSLAILAGQVYYAYLAVQSSMNIRDQGKALILLGLSFVATLVVMGMVGWIF
jgi:Yip1 domain